MALSAGAACWDATLVAAILCTAGVLHVWHWAQHRADEQKLIRLRELLDKKLDTLRQPAPADDPRQLGEKPAMEHPGWGIEITGGLNAHFKQPDGPSKPGTDWAVTLSAGQKITAFLCGHTQGVPGQFRSNKRSTWFFGILPVFLTEDGRRAIPKACQMS